MSEINWIHSEGLLKLVFILYPEKKKGKIILPTDNNVNFNGPF